MKRRRKTFHHSVNALWRFIGMMCICVQMCVKYLGTSKPMVCFLPETVIRATLGTTSESSLLWDTSLLLATGNRGKKICSLAHKQRQSWLTVANTYDMRNMQHFFPDRSDLQCVRNGLLVNSKRFLPENSFQKILLTLSQDNYCIKII